jgi:hypothetical protein
VISVNGSAARWAAVGDLIIIAAFAQSAKQARQRTGRDLCSWTKRTARLASGSSFPSSSNDYGRATSAVRSTSILRAGPHSRHPRQLQNGERS